MWTPRDIGSLTAWLRDRHGITYVSGVASEWKDPVTGWLFAQTTGANRPTPVDPDANFNGHLSLDFDGANDQFRDITNAHRDDLFTTTAGEIWLVVKPDVAEPTLGPPFYNGDDAIWSTWTGDITILVTEGHLRGIFYNTIDTGGFESVAGFSALQVAWADPLTAGLVVYRWNATDFTLEYWSREEMLSDTIGITSGLLALNSACDIGLSSQWGPTISQFNGRVAQVLTFNAELSAGDRALLQTWVLNNFIYSLNVDGDDPPDGEFYDSEAIDFLGHDLGEVVFGSGGKVAPMAKGREHRLTNVADPSSPFLVFLGPSDVRSQNTVLLNLVDPSQTVTTRDPSGVILTTKQGSIVEAVYFRGAFLPPYSGIAIQTPTDVAKLHFQIRREGGWKETPNFTGVAWGKNV